MGRTSGDLRRGGALTHRSPVGVLLGVTHSRGPPVGQDAAEERAIEGDG